MTSSCAREAEREKFNSVYIHISAKRSLRVSRSQCDGRHAVTFGRSHFFFSFFFRRVFKRGTINTPASGTASDNARMFGYIVRRDSPVTSSEMMFSLTIINSARAALSFSLSRQLRERNYSEWARAKAKARARAAAAATRRRVT